MLQYEISLLVNNGRTVWKIYVYTGKQFLHFNDFNEIVLKSAEWLQHPQSLAVVVNFVTISVIKVPLYEIFGRMDIAKFTTLIIFTVYVWKDRQTFSVRIENNFFTQFYTKTHHGAAITVWYFTFVKKTDPYARWTNGGIYVDRKYYQCISKKTGSHSNLKAEMYSWFIQRRGGTIASPFFCQKTIFLYFENIISKYFVVYFA
jgi:hypothetical protein